MNRIKELREELRWTQEDLGKLLNVQKSAVSKYETGRVQLTDEIIEKLVNIFNVSSDYILGITETRSHKPLSLIEYIKQDYLSGKSEIYDNIFELKRECQSLKNKIDTLVTDTISKKNLESIIDKLTIIQDIAEKDIYTKDCNDINYANLLYQHIISNIYFKNLLEKIIDEETVDISKLKNEATYALEHVNKNIDTRLKEIPVIENLDIYNIDQAFLDKDRNIDISQDSTFVIAAHNDNLDADQQEKMKSDAEKIKNLKK